MVDRYSGGELVDSNGAPCTAPLHQGGEESVSSTTNSQLRVTEDWKWLRVDLADNSTTVYAGSCRIGKIWVDTVMSAHACPILDDATAFASLLASTAAGTMIEAFVGARFTTSLIIDPNDVATGVILVQYREASFS